MERGLSEIEAKEKLKRLGPNIFWKKTHFDWLRFLREQVLNLFNIVLFLVFLISFFGGGKQVESVFLLIFLFLSVALSLFAELSFHHLYSKLEKYLQKKVLVLRDGKQRFILAEELVEGDIIFLSKGEKIPADCQVLKEFALFCQEQILTGENVPIRKQKGEFLFAGTEILEGEAIAKVVATGERTRFSKIGKLALSTLKKSAYQIELEKFSRALVKVVMVFFVFLVLVHLIKNSEVREALVFSLILGISIVPEFLPPITVLTLAVFTQRFAKKGNIIKRLSAIEDLGVIDILCVDKTGTLTENKLKLQQIYSSDKEKFLILALASLEGISQRYLADFKEALEVEMSAKQKEEEKNFSLKKRKLFDPSLRISQAILEKEGEKFLVVIGAPESVLSLSKNENKEEILEKIKSWAKEGLRTYALAFKKTEKEKFVEKGKKISDLEFLGVAAFEDKIKEGVKETVDLARQLGLEIKILTGDRPEVAKKVAVEIGLIEPTEPVFSEDELLEMPSFEFQRVVREGKVFARVTPETKYRIVKELQKEKLVGYLGEGINDLPTIKLANVSLVVDTAVDAAKEISDVVLLKKDLRTIIEGVLLGRSAFFNILKFLRHTMSDNFGNFFSVGFLSLFLPYFPLTPLQIIVSDFLTDLPLFALATDNVSKAEILRPAHYRQRELFLLLVALGLVAALFNLAAFFIFKDFGANIVRTAIFLQTTLSGIFVFYSVRTNDWFFKSKPSFWMHFSIILALIFTLGFLYSPLRNWVGFSFLNNFPVVIFFVFFVLFNILFLVMTDVVKKFVLLRLNEKP